MGDSNAEHSESDPVQTEDQVQAEYPYTDDFRAFGSDSSTGNPLSPSSTLISSDYASSTVSTKSATDKNANANKNVNVYTTCGRHSNEWLFSGWSTPFRRRD